MMESTFRGFCRRLWKRIKDNRGLINTTDLIVASGATIILAAGVASTSLAGIDQAKLGKAQPDAQSLGAAMQNFFTDTGKWPGQAEVAGTLASGTVTPKFLVTSTPVGSLLPSFATGVFATTVATCTGNSLEGFVGVSIAALNQPTSPVDANTVLNINDYLVRKPDPTKYPNWRGPYMQAEITTDPFGRVWLINTLPLFCAEAVDSVGGTVTTTGTSGNLGYAWIITAGPNRTLTTSLKSAKLDELGDDAGVTLSKLTKKN